MPGSQPSAGHIRGPVWAWSRCWRLPRCRSATTCSDEDCRCRPPWSARPRLSQELCGGGLSQWAPPWPTGCLVSAAAVGPDPGPAVIASATGWCVRGLPATGAGPSSVKQPLAGSIRWNRRRLGMSPELERSGGRRCKAWCQAPLCVFVTCCQQSTLFTHCVRCRCSMVWQHRRLPYA